MAHYDEMKSEEDLRRDNAVALALREIDRARISGVSAVPALEQLFNYGEETGYDQAVRDVAEGISKLGSGR